jgi:hypothetical protein
VPLRDVLHLTVEVVHLPAPECQPERRVQEQLRDV